ncbi:DNA polymerase III subunit beta [termite gut metagenome]|uniref:DNA polymerase III subunit beta n=2 Tax=termite gut metagenome TaxID=433724 RepID=A0A5J4SI89_9ZZZZ
MTFNISSSLLFSRLQAISRVINSRNSLPILDCFLFRIEDSILSVTASDSETTMITSVTLNDSDSNGSFAVVAKTILDAFKELPEQPLNFTVDFDTYGIVVKYQNGMYNLVGQNADEFPQSVTVGTDAVRLNMNGQMLMSGINRAFFATADDELRPVMNGVYFDITLEDITIVASDGHKLVRCKILDACGEEHAAFILPKKPASLLKSLLPKEAGEIGIKFDQRNAVFTLENYRMVCRLIEGRYPNYNSVIPQANPYKIIIDRQQLLSALRRVSIFSSQGSSLIKLRLQENKIIVSAQDIDFSTSAEETLVCQYTGDEMNIGFKSSFLIEILSNISATEVTIELTDPSRAGIILPIEQEENEDLLMLLMPMMLND